jgi:hypothetical protein
VSERPSPRRDCGCSPGWRERAATNFVLDPRYAAHGGFPARTPDALVSDPRAFRTEPVAVEGLLALTDRRRLSSIFEEGPDVPDGDAWVGKIDAQGAVASFVFVDRDAPTDISLLRGSRVRVVGVFHRIDDGKDRAGPVLYAKAIVRSPPEVPVRWPEPTDLAALRRTPPEAPLDDVVFARAVASGAAPRRPDADRARRPRRSTTRVRRAREPSCAWSGASRGRPSNRCAARTASPTRFRMRRSPSDSPPEVPSSSTATGVSFGSPSRRRAPVRSAIPSMSKDGRCAVFHFANRGRDGVGVSGTPGYDPERHGTDADARRRPRARRIAMIEFPLDTGASARTWIRLGDLSRGDFAGAPRRGLLVVDSGAGLDLRRSHRRACGRLARDATDRGRRR